MKTAVVTGGTKGIGLAVAESLLRRGYFVYATYAADEEAARRAEAALAVLSPHFLLLQVDQSDKAALHAFTRRLCREAESIDCLVCNAGATVRKAAKEIGDGEWEAVMQIGLNAHFYLIRDCWDKFASDARIIFIGSMMGVQPHATSLAYGVMKSAVHALARNLVKEFEGTGTTVNVIAPGFVDTEWQKNKPARIRENICNKTAAHRFAMPGEVAGAVLFCVDNAFVNGAVIEVSGGYCYK